MKYSMMLVVWTTVSALCAGAAWAAEDCSADSKKGERCKAKLADLHPTQMAVGMYEVRIKEKKISKFVDNQDELKDFEKKNPEPTVVGPKGNLFIIDHHHLGRALWDVGVRGTYCQIMANYSDLSWKEFWDKMDHKAWVYPYDQNGRGPFSYDALPQTVSDMRDDPYRSLAGEVRVAGGYEKSSVPFTEFKWANFFRSRVRIGAGDAGFKAAVKEATALAHSRDARELPGYKPR